MDNLNNFQNEKIKNNNDTANGGWFQRLRG